MFVMPLVLGIANFSAVPGSLVTWLASSKSFDGRWHAIHAYSRCQSYNARNIHAQCCSDGARRERAQTRIRGDPRSNILFLSCETTRGDSRRIAIDGGERKMSMTKGPATPWRRVVVTELKKLLWKHRKSLIEILLLIIRAFVRLFGNN